MRCLVCNQIIDDTPLALESHRKQRKGLCGTHMVERVPEAETPEAVHYERTKRARIAWGRRRWNNRGDR